VIQVKATQLNGPGAILLVKGKSQGYSDLVLISEKGVEKTLSFRVVSKKQSALAGDGGALFAPGSGLAVKPNGDGWIAKGRAANLDDWNTLQAMEAQAKGKLQSLSTIHPMDRLKAESRIFRLLRAAGLGHLAVRGAGNTILLTGNCRSAEEKALAEELAGQVVKGVRSHLRLPFEHGGQLRFRAKIMEVVRSEAQALGLDWASEVPKALVAGKAFTKASFSL